MPIKFQKEQAQKGTLFDPMLKLTFVDGYFSLCIEIRQSLLKVNFEPLMRLNLNHLDDKANCRGFIFFVVVEIGSQQAEFGSVTNDA